MQDKFPLFLCLVSCLCLAILDVMTQYCHHLHESTNELVASHSRVSVFGFVCFCVSHFWFCSCSFAVCLVDDDDGL